MASFPKEHSTLYFDALVRTQKKESVLAFIKKITVGMRL